MTPETAEKRAIKEYLRIRGAFVYHNLAGIGCYPGLADLTCAFKGRIYQIEVKAKGGRQSENQKVFQDDWEAHGGIYILGGLDEVVKFIK